MKTDIEIAQEAVMKPVTEVAASLGIPEDALESYGRYKAKLSEPYLKELSGKPEGKLVLVTAINPTPAGEGKTTTSVGLGDALSRLGKKTVAAGTLPGTLLRSQGRRCGRRIRAGRADGGFKSSFHGRFSCDHVCQ